jgi:pimeloyl-ACP methyl ester carboxylesterase
MAAALLALTFLACNTSGLSNQPRATFSQIACLDVSGDNRITGDDASVDRTQLPDFNADGDRDDHDAAFLYGIDIPLDPARDTSGCPGRKNRAPEYLVAHGYFAPAEVSCAGDGPAVLLLGVGGGDVDLRDGDKARGVRQIVDALQQEYDDGGVQTIGVIAGPRVLGAENEFGAMETWLAHATDVYLQRYPCLRVVLVGHSWGAVTTDVVAARIEDRYPGRITAVVALDRHDGLYRGDVTSRPDAAPVFNIYQLNSGIFNGAPYDAPNAENWDASAEAGPADGDQGGSPVPITHTNLDNSEAVRKRIVYEVMERSERAARQH